MTAPVVPAVPTMPVPAMPVVSDRVRALHAEMTLEEKLAQIVGFWVDEAGGAVAPMQDALGSTGDLSEVTRHGIGHLTRVYGTRPVDPIDRAAWLWKEQRRLKTETRLGIPALVHEECLTGLAAWKAATFPTPLAWGAAFDTELVEKMAASIGSSMAALGIHQGLSPVLDVIRDPRWGRVDECIGEDPYLVGTVATAYVRGLQSTGVHATLKHFVGYSASAAGRNHAPVSVGPREIADVFLPPFEMAVRDGGARSVMNAYVAVDGIPLASDGRYLTELLRETWGFTGVVVADYFAVAFLRRTQQLAPDDAAAAVLALTAGVDVELPTGDVYLEPLAEAVRSGRVDEAFVDRSVLRVLAQKEELGILDATFEDEPPTAVDLDSPEHREIARVLAEESLVLLSNDGTLPLAAPSRVAVVGPNADRAEALMGCYSFLNHVLAHHPDVPAGFAAPTVLEALREELAGADVQYARGCEVEGDDRSGFDDAVALAAASDVAVVVAGDQAGLFGRGTVGEGNDVESLELPGVQRELVEAIVATGTPVILVLLTGRPYALAWALDGERAPAAVIQAFFPGEEGGTALARVLTGRANPSGRLPISMPRSAGAQPYSYLRPFLGGPSEVTSADNAPVRPFGFGLSYTSFERTDLVADAQVAAGGTFSVSVRVRNSGEVAGTEVVQVYAHDRDASVVRPEAQLLAYRRVDLQPGEAKDVVFQVPTTRVALTDRTMTRVVEPGPIDLWVGASCADQALTATVELTGQVHVVTPEDGRVVQTEVRPVETLTSTGSA